MLNKIHKLKTMSAEEILFRVKAQLYLRTDRMRHKILGSGLDDRSFLRRVSWPSSRGASTHRRDDLLEHMRRRRDVHFYFDPANRDELVATVRRQWPSLISDAACVADAVCRHELAFLGIRVKYGEKIPWRADPVSLTEWPDGFHTEIDIFGGRGTYGDVKHVWEVNRHQFFVELGRAYFLTGDERYARKLLALMQSWVAQNPYKTGINWTSALEVAVRAISWIWAYAFCLHSRSLDSRTHLTILKSIYLHGDYLRKHLSTYFSPYNHLIGEATALSMIGGMFPEFREGREWRDTGWAILEKQASKQFHPDGFTVEQASFYHHFTLGFYLLAALLRRANEEPVSDRTWERLERATEISMWLATPDGRTPMIGDADDARSIYVSNPPLWDFRAFYSTGAVLFSRGDMKKMAREFHEDSLWLLGLDGLRKFGALEESAPSAVSRAFRDSGYYVMRSGWEEDDHYLNLDCGEIAAGVHRGDVPSAAHGHADALAIEASVWGRPMLVDPGFYTYNGDPEWHSYFRETEAHNTVVLDGHSQAKSCGRLKWSCAPRTEIHDWMSTTSFDFVDGSHDGYRSITAPGIHRRAVLFMKPDYWLIRDQVSGSGEHRLDRYFHFAPLDVVADGAPGSFRTRSPDGANLAVIGVEKDGVTAELIENGSGPEGGWLATGYGARVRAPVIRYRATARLPAVFHTLLVPFRERLPEIDVSVNGDDTRVISIRNGVTEDLFFFRTADATERLPNGLETDARIGCIRMDERGAVTRCAMIGGSVIGSGKETLLRLDRKVRWAASTILEEEPLVELSEAAHVSGLFSAARVVVVSG